jgi:hypothetical protein
MTDTEERIARANKVTKEIQDAIGDALELALAEWLKKRPSANPPEGLARLDRDTIEIGIARPALGYGIMHVYEIRIRLKRTQGYGHGALVDDEPPAKSIQQKA